MHTKKIAVIIESININDSSCTKCNVALIENLALIGHKLTVYHYTRKNIELKEINCVNIKEIKFSFNYLFSKTQLIVERILNITLYIFFQRIFGFSFTLFNDVNSIKKSISKFQNDDFDLIITMSKGSSFRPHYAMLAFPELHPKWMANIHDPYPFHFNPRPYTWVEPGYQIKEKYFRAISEKARYSSFPSQLLKEWMGSYFPNFLKTGVVIPHQNADYKIHDIVLPDYFDNSIFNLLHAGNLMPQRSPEGLIEGYKLFLKNNPDAKHFSKLILLGPASAHTKILEESQLNNPEIHIYNGTVPFDLVYKLQKNVSVNIILESKSEISPFLPGKFPHCVEADKPIISLAPYYSEVKRLFGEKYPYWAEVDDCISIASIIESLYKEWKLNPVNLKLNRKDLLAYLSADYLREIIENLK